MTESAEGGQFRKCIKTTFLKPFVVSHSHLLTAFALHLTGGFMQAGLTNKSLAVCIN